MVTTTDDVTVLTTHESRLEQALVTKAVSTVPFVLRELAVSWHAVIWVWDPKLSDEDTIPPDRENVLVPDWSGEAITQLEPEA